MTTVAMQKNPSKALNVVFWIIQILLGGMFIMVGFMKLSQPIEKLTAMFFWPGDVPPALVRFIGLSELLGGIGLILPAALRIKPVLTAWAALGLFTIMVFAVIFHISRGEEHAVGMPLLYGALAALVSWGRFKKVPIAPRKVVPKKA